MTAPTAVLATIMLLSATMPAHCQSSPFSARIRVQVTGELIADELKTCLAKELRGFPNVVVADENPRFSAVVLAMPLASAFPGTPGIAASLLIYAFRQEDTVADYELGVVIVHTLHLDGNVRGMCSDIVADIDQHAIEMARKRWQQDSDAHAKTKGAGK